MDQDLVDVRKLQQGQLAALESLMNRHRDYAYTIAYRVLKDAHQAEEVAQDSFVKIYKHIKDFRGDSKFKTWLYRIVYTTALSRLRSEKRHRQQADLDDHSQDSASFMDHGSDLFEQYRTKEKRALIEKGLARLNSEEGAAISMFYFKEMSLIEIADITEQSANTVKVRLFRARKKLATELQKMLQDEYSGLRFAQ
jgi:RNA polymerase sigma-70 factor (ECF subfamily)